VDGQGDENVIYERIVSRMSFSMKLIESRMNGIIICFFDYINGVCENTTR